MQLKHLHIKNSQSEMVVGPLASINVTKYMPTQPVKIQANVPDPDKKFMFCAQYDTDSNSQLIVFLGSQTNGSFYAGKISSVETIYKVMAKITECTVLIKDWRFYTSIHEFMSDEIALALSGQQGIMPNLDDFLTQIGANQPT